MSATGAEVRSEYVTLANGARAHYLVSGPEDGAPVVLLHGGLPGSSGAAGWRFMLPELGARGLRVYAPDRPGFGEADTRPQYWPRRGFLSWADFVRDFADALGLDRFQIGGNSQGTQTGCYFAVQYPERVERMAMIACGGLNPVLEIPADRLTAGVAFPKWDGTEDSMREMLGSIVYRVEALDADLIAMRNQAALRQRESLASADEWNRRALIDPAFGQAHRLRDRLEQLSIPMVYLYGRQDVLGPVENAYLQEERLPNVQFFFPDECGHQGQTDQPEMFNQLFFEFFTRGQVTRRTAEWAGLSTRRPELSGIIAE